MTPKDPFLEGTFWDKFWRPLRSLCLLPISFSLSHLSSLSLFTVRSGTAWRQDLAILSPEGFRDSTFQLRGAQYLQGTNGYQNHPKDPAVLKILRVVNLLHVVFLVRRDDLLSRRTLCGHHFPGNYRHFSSQRRAHGVVNLGGVVKTLRRSNSLFFISS